jgi:V/A-type H+-transporting ATPase subunit K
MNTLLFFVVPLIFVALILAPLVPLYRRTITGKKAKHTLIFNLVSFFGCSVLAAITPIGQYVAFAADAATMGTGAGLAYLGAGLATGMACIGAGIAVANGASAAIGACAEDPKSFGRSIVFVALGEGVAIYGLLISIMIINSIA